MVHTEGNVDEGYFEKTFFREHPETIESYDWEDDCVTFKAGYILKQTRAMKFTLDEVIEIPPKVEVEDRMDFEQDKDE